MAEGRENVSRRLPYMEIELGQIAQAAAKAGALKDELRVWKSTQIAIEEICAISKSFPKPLLREFPG
ncbi:MAG: hypothetical protein M3449_07355 [Acidobacteriota bacterium]|nr:hypothetical protein [Acidobacteriota bacterium]